jgi:hypothetical protein
MSFSRVKIPATIMHLGSKFEPLFTIRAGPLAEYFDRSDLLRLTENQIDQSRVIGGILPEIRSTGVPILV